MNAASPPAAHLKRGITLYLIRHGETDWNKEARYQGQRDIPLNDTGRYQARRHGQILGSLLPEIASFDFVSSPLGRAVETMKLIRSGLGLEPNEFRTEPQIMELSYGHWEGELAAVLGEKDPRALPRRRAIHSAGGPKEGESYCDLQVRVAAWLDALERDTVAVTHGGVSRVARGAILGIETHRVPFLEAPQDAILKLTNGAMAWL